MVLSFREEKLIKKANTIYNSAVERATKEFKKLEGIAEGKKLSDAEVKSILNKASKAFATEFKKLVQPIIEATQDSYEDGLAETGQIVKGS